MLFAAKASRCVEALQGPEIRRTVLEAGRETLIEAC
jgi:hypothetical protein